MTMLKKSLYKINKEAKSLRDLAEKSYSESVALAGDEEAVAILQGEARSLASEKRSLYRLKERVIEIGIKTKDVKIIGYHEIEGNLFCLYDLDGLLLHSPNNHTNKKVKNLGNIDRIEARQSDYANGITLEEAYEYLQQFIGLCENYIENDIDFTFEEIANLNWVEYINKFLDKAYELLDDEDDYVTFRIDDNVVTIDWWDGDDEEAEIERYQQISDALAPYELFE